MEYERQSREQRQHANTGGDPIGVQLSGPVGLRWRVNNVTNASIDKEKVIGLLAAISAKDGGKKETWSMRPPAGPSGMCPKNLADAIWDFQTWWKALGVFKNIDGVVDPGGNTLRQLYKLASPGGYKPVPPGPLPPKPTPEGLDEWYVTNLSLSGGTIIPGVGGGGFSGQIDFEHFGVSGNWTLHGNMFIAGVGFGVSVGVPWLKGSWFENVVKFLSDNGGLSYSGFPARTIGLCFPNRGAGYTKLSADDFYGPCVTHFVSGNIFVGGYGAWALYFGLPATQNWLVYLGQSVQPMLKVGSEIAEKAKGVALISSGGFGVALSAGASVNIFAGEISRGKPNIWPDPSVRK
jgi:hypothetical protein